jgi:hypothetical protein
MPVPYSDTNNALLPSASSAHLVHHPSHLSLHQTTSPLFLSLSPRLRHPRCTSPSPSPPLSLHSPSARAVLPRSPLPSSPPSPSAWRGLSGTAGAPSCTAARRGRNPRGRTRRASCGRASWSSSALRGRSRARTMDMGAGGS